MNTEHLGKHSCHVQFLTVQWSQGHPSGWVCHGYLCCYHHPHALRWDLKESYRLRELERHRDILVSSLGSGLDCFEQSRIPQCGVHTDIVMSLAHSLVSGHETKQDFSEKCTFKSDSEIYQLWREEPGRWLCRRLVSVPRNPMMAHNCLDLQFQDIQCPLLNSGTCRQNSHTQKIK